MNNLNLKTFFKNNSSTILTVTGSIGVVITAALSARDTLRAMKRIEEVKPIETKRKVELVVPCYIPTFISGLSTILCICASNKINKNTQKSLSSAYVLLNRAYNEYQNAVKEEYGKEGEMKVVNNIAQKKMQEVETIKSNDKNEDMFFDFYSLQFFSSTLEKIKKAEEAANDILNANGYITLEEVHSLLGEPSSEEDRILGWVDNGCGYNNLIEIETTVAPKSDGQPYYILDFINGPDEL